MQFDPEKVTRDVIEWTRNWFQTNGPGCNAVVGISGGKDSSIVAAICAKALGPERVIGVLLPNGVQPDIDVARALVEFLGIRSVEINIQAAFDAIYGSVQATLGEVSEQTRQNLAPRIRMTTLYAVSQSRNGRVANTCNLSEDWVGYSTRYGDSAGDFSPLSQLTVQEIKAMGSYLGLPAKFVDKPPIDGLCGKTDEENLGFSYAVLDRYIRTGECDDEKIRTEIDRRHKANQFKLSMFPSFPYEGPVFPS